MPRLNFFPKTLQSAKTVNAIREENVCNEENIVEQSVSRCSDGVIMWIIFSIFPRSDCHVCVKLSSKIVSNFHKRAKQPKCEATFSRKNHHDRWFSFCLQKNTSTREEHPPQLLIRASHNLSKWKGLVSNFLQNCPQLIQWTARSWWRGKIASIDKWQCQSVAYGGPCSPLRYRK